MNRVVTHGRALATIVVLLTLPGLTACANREQAADPTASSPTTAEPVAFPVEVSVPGGKPVRLERRPQRIVSLNPTSTEMLFAIGADKQVIAVDELSNYPQHAPRTQLSGFNPNVEAITGFNPDLVVLSNDINDLLPGLDKLKIPALLLPSASRLDDTYDQIAALGKATGNPRRAEDLVRRTRQDIEKIVKDTPKPSQPLRYYHELEPSLFSATSKTFIGQVYGLFGLSNIADAADSTGGGYPQLSAEHVVNANPDLIFLADAKCCGQNAQAVAARPGWSSLNAVRNGRVIALDDDIASRWGPRVVDQVRAVADAISKIAGK